MSEAATFNLAGACNTKFTLRANHMKTNSPVTLTRVRRSLAAAVAGVFVGGAGLIAAPASVASELLDDEFPPAQSASAECAARSEQAPIFVVLQCHERDDLAARLSPHETRAQVAPVRSIRLELAGVDLLASRPGEIRVAPLATAQSSPFDFAPGARAVGPLRWTWASVAWKF